MKTTRRPRVALFVAQDFGYQFISRLHGSLDADLFVVSYDDRFDRYYGYRSALEYCKSKNISCFDFSMKNGDLARAVKDFDPFLIACGYFAKILPQNLISLSARGAFNVHPGSLPKYRGPFPTAWAILNNETSFGITIHSMDSGIDTGDIAFQATYEISPSETGFELYKRSMLLAAELYVANFDKLMSGDFRLTKQVGYGSYWGNLPSHVHIDWQRRCIDICNEVRVHALPYYPAYSYVKNKCILIKKCSLVLDVRDRSQGPGKILKVNDDGSFVVSGVDGCILVQDYECVPSGNKSDLAYILATGARLS